MLSSALSVDDAAHWLVQERLLMAQLLGLIGKHHADTLLREMLHLMAELLGLTHGHLVLADPAGARIRFGYGLTEGEMRGGVAPHGASITSHVLATGQPIVVQDHEALVQFLALPIQAGHRTIGVLACQRSVTPRQRALRDDLALLKLLCLLAGQALQGHAVQPQAAATGSAPVSNAAALASPPLVRSYLPAHSHTALELEDALRRHFGNQSRAARALGLTTRQFNYRLRKAREQD